VTEIYLCHACSYHEIQDGNAPGRYFAPNFHPPYDTPEKRKLIADVLSREWHSPTLSWVAAPCEPSALAL
jgi:hypothetical protein